MQKTTCSTLIIFTLIGLLLAILPANAQTYTIADGGADDCEGTLTDSNVGAEDEGHYAHDENFVFVLCVENAQNITLTFGEFCTEDLDDVLTIYEGDDTSAPVIGSYSGNVAPLPIITLGECLTFEFSSDLSVSCTGWEANWEAELEPDPPLSDFEINNDIPCFSTDFVVDLSVPVSCDALDGGTFSLNGPGTPNIANLTPINCIGGFTQ